MNETYLLNNGLTIPKLGYGTFQTPSDDTGIAAIEKALELGYRHIDTAQGYKNEASVGIAIQNSGVAREQLFVTTKVANAVEGFENTLKSIDASLEKLQLSYLDLVLIHWPAPLPYRDHWQQRNAQVWRALEHYCAVGKIKSIGISNFKSHHLNALLESAQIIPAVNQIRLCPGDVDQETVDACLAHNILLQAYSPLGQGLVFASKLVQELAEKYQKNPAQIALRWSLERGFLPLPKSVTEQRIKDNMAIFDFQLAAEDVQQLNAITGECGTAKDPDSVPF